MLTKESPKALEFIRKATAPFYVWNQIGVGVYELIGVIDCNGNVEEGQRFLNFKTGRIGETSIGASRYLIKAW
jgi:hypothetical protein